MAQEDKALVVRGLLLFTGIGILAASVLAIVFWRSHTATPPFAAQPEQHIPAVMIPHVGSFPANVNWFAIQQLGETMPSAPGWDIRYNAATAYLRRGSTSVPWHLVREMLDERQQMRNNRVRLIDGRDVYDEAGAREKMLIALKALAAWHDKRKVDQNRDVPNDLREIYSMVDRLAESEFPEMKIQAEKARATFFR